jgi:Zn-dependent peptidase ImmA (M78 family)
VPREALLAEGLVAAYPPRRREWSDDELGSLARTFAVSIHVILRRLLTAGRTTQAFYEARHARWRVFEPPPTPDSDDEYRRNMPQEVVSDLGRPFTRLLLDSHSNSRMSLSDVSRYLGVRAQQVERVREIISRGG